MADDMAPWAMGVANDPNAITPNIDSIAKQGAIFNKCFAMSPVCSPARACMLTGLYSTETGITDFLCEDKHHHLGISRDTATWSQKLQENGYRTGLFGKWHIGDADRFHPTHNGYDIFKGWRGGAKISKDPLIEIDGKEKPHQGYTSDIITDYALDFIKETSEQPFLVSLHFWAPHSNQDVYTEDGDRTWHPLKPEDWDLFKDMDPIIPNPDYPNLDVPRVKRMMREYLASVHSIDRNIGRILTLLKELRIDDNTAIIFTSDNGYNLGHNGIWHKGNGWWILTNNRGDRPNMYDNSLQVPTVVKCPGIVKENTVIDTPVTTLDWFPTILSIAGIEPDEELNLRGLDLTCLMKGKDIKTRNGLFSQYQMWDWNQTGADLRAYRTTDWKLIVDFKQTVPNELYHLSSDPDETNNLYYQNSEEISSVKTDLFERMRKSMLSINDPALTNHE